jgi:hypothetical protein
MMSWRWELELSGEFNQDLNGKQIIGLFDSHFSGFDFTTNTSATKATTKLNATIVLWSK